MQNTQNSLKKFGYVQADVNNRWGICNKQIR